jgi:hypothetical protein
VVVEVVEVALVALVQGWQAGQVTTGGTGGVGPDGTGGGTAGNAGHGGAVLPSKALVAVGVIMYLVVAVVQPVVVPLMAVEEEVALVTIIRPQPLKRMVDLAVYMEVEVEVA